MKRFSTMALAGLAGLALPLVALAQPANDNCETPAPVGEGIHAFNNTGGTNQYVGSCTPGYSDVFFLYTPTMDGSATVETCTLAAFDTTLVAYPDCDAGELACNDDACGLQSRITFPVSNGISVLIRVASYSAAVQGAGSVSIAVTPPPPPPSWDESVNGGGDAGELPSTAQDTSSGTGTLDSMVGAFGASDADMYLIGICDVGTFSATTFNAATTVDTQLWLFNLDGTGVVFNDDVPDGFPGDATLQSRISGAFVPAAGNYYLAISRYNRDPVDEFGGLLWANTPFNFERTPDGPSAASPVFAWTGVTTGAATYRINLTGACFPTTGPSCDGDVNCDFALDGFDVEVQEKAVGGDITDYCQANPDFNGDFALDGFDVEAVEVVVGGGPCP